MFYIKEIAFRIIYFSITLLCLFLYFFNYNTIFLNVFLSGIIHNNNIFLQNFESSFFICSPNQLLEKYFMFYLLIIFIISIPYVYWSLLRFLKSALTKSEAYFNIIMFFQHIFLFYFFNYFIFFFLFPFCWYSLELMNLILLNSTFLNIEYEPNFSLYATLLYTFFKIANFVLFLLVLFLEFNKNIKLITFIYYNRLFLFICFFLLLSFYFFILNFFLILFLFYCFFYMFFSILKFYIIGTLLLKDILKRFI